MKFQLAKYVLLVAAFGLATQVVDAQTRKKTTRKAAPTTKKTSSKTTQSNTATANLNAKAADTVMPVVIEILWPSNTRKSLRNDAAVERNLVKTGLHLPMRTSARTMHGTASVFGERSISARK